MEENVIRFNASVKALEKSVIATNHAMSELGWLVKDLQKSFSAGFGGGISGELAGIIHIVSSGAQRNCLQKV